MTKQRQDQLKPCSNKPDTVSERKVRGPDGRLKTMRFIDLGSTTLSDDLTYLFRKNVEKARRDNRRITGSADGVPASE